MLYGFLALPICVQAAYGIVHSGAGMGNTKNSRHWAIQQEQIEK